MLKELKAKNIILHILLIKYIGIIIAINTIIKNKRGNLLSKP
jgi:hypothetical protein